MTANPTREFLGMLGRKMLLRDGAGLTDAQLLELFLERRDKQYLEAIVARHTRMVWEVCCRNLWNQQDAEDAFQATWLTVSKRADSFEPKRGSGANWIYGIARCTALTARRTSARRSRREKLVPRLPDLGGHEEHCMDELRCVLDEELLRLPEIYRDVVVLCCLEGKTREEAAKELDQAAGTVASRLARAREMLETRLTRRGLAVSGVLTAAFWQQGVSAATVKPLGVKASAAIALADRSFKISLCKKWMPLGLLALVSAGTAGGIAVSNRVVYDVSSQEAMQLPVPSLARPTQKDPEPESDQKAAGNLATRGAHLATITLMIRRDIEKIVFGSRADVIKSEMTNGLATIELRWHTCAALLLAPIYDIRINYGIQEGKLTLEYRTTGETCWHPKDWEKPIRATVGDRGPEWLVLGRSQFKHIKALLDELRANAKGCG